MSIQPQTIKKKTLVPKAIPCFRCCFLFSKFLIFNKVRGLCGNHSCPFIGINLNAVMQIVHHFIDLDGFSFPSYVIRRKLSRNVSVVLNIAQFAALITIDESYYKSKCINADM